MVPDTMRRPGSSGAEEPLAAPTAGSVASITFSNSLLAASLATAVFWMTSSKPCGKPSLVERVPAANFSTVMTVYPDNGLLGFCAGHRVGLSAFTTSKASNPIKVLDHHRFMGTPPMRLFLARLFHLDL